MGPHSVNKIWRSEVTKKLHYNSHAVHGFSLNKGLDYKFKFQEQDLRSLAPHLV